MKKFLALLMVATLSLGMLAACSTSNNDDDDVNAGTDTDMNDTTPDVTPDATPEVTPEINEDINMSDVMAEILTKLEGDIPAIMEVPAEMVPDLYAVDSELLEESLVYMPMMMVTATEFAMFKVKDAADLSAVQTAVEDRIADLVAQWESYLADQLEIVNNYQVTVQGNYVLVSISEYNDIAENIFLRAFDPSIEELEHISSINSVEGVISAVNDDLVTIDTVIAGEPVTIDVTVPADIYIETLGLEVEIEAGVIINVVFTDYIPETGPYTDLVATYASLTPAGEY